MSDKKNSGIPTDKNDVKSNIHTVGHDNLSHSPHPDSVGDVTTTHSGPGDVSTAPAPAAKTRDRNLPAARVEWPTSPESYTLIGKIGQGAFASVWRATYFSPPSLSSTSTAESEAAAECAIKILNLEHVDTSFIDIRLEVQTMRLSSHHNVLNCFTSFVHDTNLWLVTQLMKKGSSIHCIQNIRDKMTRLRGTDDAAGGADPVGASSNTTETIARMEEYITYILHETLLGLKYIHDNGQIHRDIKAGNILLDETGDVRIADFGVSSWLIHGGSRRDNTKTFVGTPCWMAPEVMEQVHGYDYKADIWSLGITALELAKGYAPYAKYPPMKVLLLTIQEDPPSLETYEDDDDVNKWSKSFRAMIKLCLQKDPAKRPTCEELLAHKHFKRFSEEEFRLLRRQQLQTALCEMVDDVGEGGVQGSREQQKLPGTAPVYVVSSTEENRPAGTTWIFSDGSQVIASSSHGKDGELDKDEDFFDEFERTTGGENFSSQKAMAEEAMAKQAERDEMNDFFDEFEKSTGGENFRRRMN